MLWKNTRATRLYRFAALLFVIAGCDSRVVRDNPYDPNASEEKQVPAEILGVVVSDAAVDPATVSVALDGRTTAGTRVTEVAPEITVTDGFVHFSFKVPAGVYRVSASAPTFESAEKSGLEVFPADVLDVGVLKILAGRGSLSGIVLARSPTGENTAPPLDTRVMLLRLVAPVSGDTLTASCSEPGAEEAVFAPLRADGSFVAMNLAAGPYLVTAERDGYVPAASRGSVDVQINQIASAGDLVLLRAQNMARIVPSAHPEASPLGLWSSDLNVTLELVIPPLYNGMLVSEDPTFSDPLAGDTEFGQTQVTLPWSLPSGDGVRELFVQFRSPTCQLSPVFSAQIIIDQTAPVVEPPALASGAACTSSTLVSLSLSATDPCPESSACSGLYQMRLATDGVVDDEPWVGFERQTTLDLLQDGDHGIALQLKDRAGNLSSPAVGTIRVDATGPSVGVPAYTVDSGQSTVRSQNVVLTLNVTGATRVEVGNGPGLDGSRWMPMPVTGQLAWRLADGDDGPRQLAVRYADDCGNVTDEFPLVVALDRSGRFTGSVRLEGGAAPAGATISVWRHDGADYQDLGLAVSAGASGAFAITGLEPGMYRLVVSASGFVSRSLDALDISEGALVVLPEVMLAIARGDLAGNVTLQGETSHDGILVEAAPGIVTFTDSNGDFLFMDLPVGEYLVSAEKGAAYQRRSATSLVSVSTDELTVVPSFVLEPVPGSIHGTVLRAGVTVQSGTDVVVVGITAGGTEASFSTTTQDDGTFSVSPLTAGTYSASFSASGFRTASVGSLVVSPGESLDVGTVHLNPATGGVSGTVALVGRTDHGGVRISLAQAGIEKGFTYSASDGSFALSGISAGEYTATFTATGFGTKRLTSVAVLADQVTPLAPQTLAAQVGDVSFRNVGQFTNQTSVEVIGSYPDVAAGRFCERPGVTDPAVFTDADCPYQTVSFAGGQPTFDPVTVAFAASPCPNPGDPVSVCDGAKTVWVRLRDTSNAESSWFELPIVLDRLPPTGHVVIAPNDQTLAGLTITNGGAAYTSVSSVSVLLVAEEDRSGVAAGGEVSGVVGARLFRTSTDASPVSVTMEEGSRRLQAVALAGAASPDGPRNLILELRDAAGNLSVVDTAAARAAIACPDPRAAHLPSECDSIFLDQHAPASIAFSVQPLDLMGSYAVGAAYSQSPLVQLGIDSTLSGLQEDEAVEAVIANDANFTAAIVQPLPAARTVVSWALTPGDGAKTVYLKVRDRAGNLSAAFQDGILLDTIAPETPVPTPGPAYTLDSTPTLGWGAVPGASGYRFQLSDGSSFDGSGAVNVDQVLTGTTFTATALADGLYFWRVRAEDDAGHTSAFSAAVGFTVDTVKPTAPELGAVASPSANNRPSLTWGSIADALSYELQIDSSTAFNTAGLVSRTTAVTTLTSPVLVDDTWYARVRAFDAAGNASGWSAVVTFVVDTTAPGNANPTAPAASVILTSSSVSLTWDPVAGAIAYVLQISSSADMTAFEEYLLSTTQKTHALPDGSWTFRVGAQDAAGNRSDLSTAPKRTFSVDTTPPSTPVLTEQPALISTRTPTFTWSNESASGATSYTLRVDGRTYTTSATTLTPSDSLADGSHWWTVAANDAAGNASAFAATQGFEVDATPPDAPVLTPVDPDPTSSTAPRFAFSAVAGAVSYQVEWDTSVSFATSGTNYHTQTIATTVTQPDAPLAVQGTWYWRVTAIDAAGNRSTTPPVDSFVLDTVAPADPALTSPNDGARLATNNVTMSWTTPAGATSYRLEIATDSSFTSPSIHDGLTVASKTVYLGDGVFWARAIAYDAAGNASPGGSSRSFTIDTTSPDTPVAGTISSPINDNTPTFGWSDTSSTGATGYRVRIDSTVSSVSGTSYTPATALDEGSHTFAVAAVDEAGNVSPFSAVQVFVVDTTPPAVPTLDPVSPNPTNVTSQTHTWSGVADAVNYDVEWDTTSSFNSTNRGSATVTTNRHQVGPLAAGTWYWRVRAKDTAANASGWSTALSYVIDVTAPANPALQSPANDAWSTASTVTFTWSSVADASAYLFDLSQSPTLATYERTSLSATSRSVALPDGSWYWRVLAQDAAGNVSSAASATIRRVQVDTVPPGVPVLTAHPSPTNDTTPTLAWGAVTGATQYVVTLAGAPTTTASTSYTPSALADGTHTWTVAARDAAGNQSATAPSQSILVDSTPPDVPVPTPYTPDPTADNTPTVVWSGVAEAASYTVRWDTTSAFNSGALVTRTTTQTSYEIGPLTNDRWYWCVLATDAVGNASACSAASSFEVDTSAPPAPGLTAPADNSTSTAANVAFSWGSVAGATGYRLQVGSDSALATIVFDVNGIAGLTKTLTLNDNVYYWRVLATDAAGNQTPPGDASVQIWQVTVDANAPGRPTMALVPTPGNDATPTFGWSDESASGAVSYDLVIDSTNVSVADVTYTPSSNLADGSHTVRVASRDGAGNLSAYSATQTFFIDTAAPTGLGGLSPANSAVLVSSTVTLSWDAASDASDISYVLQVARASDFASRVVDTTVTGSTATVSTDVVLGDGDYFWRVRARDAAGNQSNWAPNASGRSFTVDTTPPSVPVLVAVGALVNASPTLRWSNEAASGAVNYRLQVDDDPAFGSPAINTLVGDVTQYATALTPDGTWYWRVRALDDTSPANASAYSAADSFVLDTTPPGAPTAPAPAAGLQTSNPSVSFSWTAPVGGAASYRLDIGYDSAFTAIAQQVTTSATSATLSFPDGTYYWRVYARDAAGNLSLSAAGGTSFTIDTVAPRRPVAQTIPTWVGSAQTTYTVGWSDEADSGASGYELQVSASSTFATLVDSLSLTDTSATRSRPSPDGTFYWRVRAVDGVGNASLWSATQSFGVDTVAPGAFTLSAPGGSTYDTDGSVSLSWNQASDANPVTYRLQIGLVSDFSNQVVVDVTQSSRTSLQSLSNALYYWRVTARDAAGNERISTAAPWQFTVDTVPPDAPSFSSFPTVTNDTTPNLAWTTVSGATGYRVLIDDATDFATPVKTIDVTGTSLANGDYATPISSDGTYYAQVTATDAAGNRSAASTTLSFVLDTLAPGAPTTCAFTPYAVYGAPQPTYDEGAVADSTPSLWWSAVTGATSFELQTQQYGAGWTPRDTIGSIPPSGTLPVTFTLPSSLALGDGGLYWFRVRAFDAAGNASGYRDCAVTAAGRIYLRSDQAAPAAVTGLSLTTTNPTNGTTLAFTWNKMADATNRGEMGYTLRLLAADGVTVLQARDVAWSSPYAAGTRSSSFTGLSHGTYYVSVSAYDAALNEGAAAVSAAFVVDRVAPDTPLLYSPLRQGVSGPVQRLGTLTPTFTWSSAAASGATSYTLNIFNSTSGALKSTLARTVSALDTTTHTLAASLTNGAYYRWEITALDAAGNGSTPGATGPSTELGWFQLDTSPPNAVVSLYMPSSGATLNATSLYFRFSTSTSTDVATYTLEVYDDGGNLYYEKTCALRAGTVCYASGSTAYIIPTDALFAAGTYSWRVRATDDVGNESTWQPSAFPSTQTFTIDNTPPEPPTLDSPVNNSFTKSTAVTFSWVPTDDSGATGYRLYVQQLSGSTWYYVTGYSPRTITGGTTYQWAATMPSKGKYRWFMYATDAAGNVSTATAMSYFTIDQDVPNTPTLLTVDARNRAARLFWNAVTDNPTNSSGIGGYRIYYGQSSPPSTAVNVGNVTDAWVTGLDNKRDYYFAITAVDGAGNESARSAEQNRPVGWSRNPIPIVSAYPLRPVGVVAQGQDVYVLYMEMSYEWTDPSGNLKVAVSNDGGETWTFRTLDSSFGWLRTSAIAQTATGIMATTIGSNQDPNGLADSPATAWQDRGAVRAYYSGDSGSTWTNTYASASTSVWGKTDGIALVPTSDYVYAYYLLGHDTNNVIYDLYSSNSGQSASNGSTFYELSDTDLDTTEQVRGCAGNYYRFVAWKQAGAIKVLASNFLRDGLFDTSSDPADGTVTTVVSSASTPDRLSFACSSHSAGARLYVVYNVGASLYVRRSVNSGGSWYSAVTVASDYDANYDASVWGGGDNVYVAYRNTSGNLILAESTSSGSTWTRTELTTGGYEGYYPVLSGKVTSDVVMVYTDAEGYSLTYLQPALGAVPVRPLPGVGSASLTWQAALDVDMYRIDHGTSLSLGTKDLTSLTSFPVTTAASDEYYAVRPMDENGEPGNDGEVWRVSPFEETNLIPSANVTGTMSSANADVVAYTSGSTRYLAVLPPYGVYASGDVSTTTYIYRSSDGGATFSKETVGTYPMRVMEGRDGRLVFAGITSGGALQARYYSSMTTTSATAHTLVASGLTSSDLVSVGIPQAGSSAGRVMVAWADVSADSIDFAWSTDYGATFTARNAITIPSSASATVEALEVGPIDGSVVTVFWRQYDSSAGYSYIYYVRSTDGGTTWSTAQAIRSNTTVDDDTILNSASNDAHGIVANVTYDNSAEGKIPSLLLGVNAGYFYSTSTTYRHDIYLDRDQIGVRHFDLVSSPFGQYLVYQSKCVSCASTTYKLEMAFCFADCHQMESWIRRTLASTSSSSDFNAPSIAVSNGGEIFVTYKQATGGNALKLLRLGRLSRAK